MRRLLVLVVLWGCGQERVEEEPVVRYDSAGVHIVHSHRPAHPSDMSWEPFVRPLLEIGIPAGGPQEELFRVTDALRLPDGRIVVANDGTKEIRVYDGSGGFIRSFGGAGDGPGEFLEVSALEHLGGDTLVAFDLHRRRISRILLSSAETSDHSIADDGIMPLGRPTWLPGHGFVLGWHLTDGLGQLAAGDARLGETVRNQAVLRQYGPSGATLDTLGTFPGFEESVVARSGGPGVAPTPLGRGLVHAAAPDGIYVGTQERHEIGVYGLDGELKRIIRWDGPDLDPEGEFTEVLEKVRPRVENPDELLDYLRGIPRPPTRAAYGDLLVDDDGHLWVSEYRYLDLWPNRWSVFDADGAWVVEVEIPEGGRLLRVHEGHAIVLIQDALGVETVALYRLALPGAVLK